MNYISIFPLQIEKDDVKETVSPDGSTFSDMLFSAAIQQDKEKVESLVSSLYRIYEIDTNVRFNLGLCFA